MGLLISIFYWPNIILTLLIGYLIDKFGKKKKKNL